MINMLRTLIQKVDNMQEQMDNTSRDENSKNQKYILEIKNSITGIMKVFSMPLCRPDMVEKRIFELMNTRL